MIFIFVKVHNQVIHTFNSLQLISQINIHVITKWYFIRISIITLTCVHTCMYVCMYKRLLQLDRTCMKIKYLNYALNLFSPTDQWPTETQTDDKSSRANLDENHIFCNHLKKKKDFDEDTREKRLSSVLNCCH